MIRKPVVGMVSLGCPKNLVDAESMLAALGSAGYVISGDASSCDALIVNTCAFIAAARAEAVATIREFSSHKRNRCQALVVTGCLAQDWGDALRRRLPEVDAIVGTGSTDRIVDVVTRTLAGDRPTVVGHPGGALGSGPRLLTTPGHYAYLKIAEGCDAGCTFCVIPRLRGRQTSRPARDIVAEARDLAGLGVRELILVAQDTGSYGRDLGLRDGLAGLLRELGEVSGIEWLRLMYLNPGQVTDELCRAMGEVPTVCRYVDLPVQHGSDVVLSAMGRDEGQVVERAVSGLRARMKDPALRTTLLIGFPGETERDIELAGGLLRDVQFDHVGMFRFSPQSGTRAAELGARVPAGLADERIGRLMALQRDIAARRAHRWVGCEMSAVVEQSSDGEAAGRTEFQAPDIDPGVLIRGTAGVGEVLTIRVTDAGEWGLEGEIVTS